MCAVWKNKGMSWQKDAFQTTLEGAECLRRSDAGWQSVPGTRRTAGVICVNINVLNGCLKLLSDRSDAHKCCGRKFQAESSICWQATSRCVQKSTCHRAVVTAPLNVGDGPAQPCQTPRRHTVQGPAHHHTDPEQHTPWQIQPTEAVVQPSAKPPSIGNHARSCTEDLPKPVCPDWRRAGEQTAAAADPTGHSSTFKSEDTEVQLQIPVTNLGCL